MLRAIGERMCGCNGHEMGDMSDKIEKIDISALSILPEMAIASLRSDTLVTLAVRL
jgi:hypothetical protein